MIQVDWLMSTREGIEFLLTICKSDDCLPLLKTTNLKQITDHYWTICRPFFVWDYFAPFLKYVFIPQFIMATTLQGIENREELGLYLTIFIIALIVFMFGMLGLSYSEYNELKKRGAWRYFTSFDNYNQILLVFFGFCYIITSISAQHKFWFGDS